MKRLRELWFPGRGLPPGAGGQEIAGYNLETGRVVVPLHVRSMSRRDRQRWFVANGVVPVIGGGDDFHYAALAQPYMDANLPAALSNSTTETGITADTFLTLPGNYFAWVGKRIWLHCAGPTSNVVTTPGTLTLRVRWGGSAGTLLATTGAIPYSTTAATNNLWILDCYITCIAHGPLTTNLTLRAYGDSWVANTVGTAAALQAVTLPPALTALADVTSLDGTVAKALTVTAQFSVSTSPTNIQVSDSWVMALN